MWTIRLTVQHALLAGAMLFIIGAMVTSYGCGAAAAELPVGNTRPALAADHFPSSLYAVVWRNWELVPKERIARVVQATPEQIGELAQSMGLPPTQHIAPDVAQRGFITIVRRNWHLLPYDQLLLMLDMTAGELAERLREDDFLFIKLGSFKPQCEQVLYRLPSDGETKRAAEIRELVQREFGAELEKPGEARFAFLHDFDKAPSERVPATTTTTGSLRFLYSYFAPFGDPLLDGNLEPYPDGLLARLQDQGVNGVWLHAVLRDLAPASATFPEFGTGSDVRLRNLKQLTQRCARYGIKVYLYMNEPRAMPSEFFANRTEMRGVKEGNFYAMCTSDPRVLTWVSDALAGVFKEVPMLGGVFTITASENLTHCASHGGQKGCPRCAGRSAAELITEVNTAIRDGIRRSSPNARVICWDWGWNGHGDAPEIIAALPDGVDLMSVSEWALPLDRGGVHTNVGEYSLSVIGPGQRSTRHWKVAKERGLGAIAKVQVNNSWELSAVPWLPVEDIVASHSLNLSRAGVDGMMLSWSLGGYPSPNLQVAQIISDIPGITADEALQRVAVKRYGSRAAPAVRAAWTAFSNAFAEFPYSQDVLYMGPQQLGPANLLYEKPTGYHATMVGFPYDDLTSWRGPYPAEVWITQFEKVSVGWQDALGKLRTALANCDVDKRPVLESDIRLAEAAGIHFASCANQTKFIVARDKLSTAPAEQAQREALGKLLIQEKDLAKRLYTLTKADSRIGFEASNHYYYVPLDLIEKVINCQWNLERMATH